MKKTMVPGAGEIRSLVDTAMGDEKADLAILNADIANVYTGELLKGWSVAIKGERIAFVGADASHTIGPETEVINASGKTLIPGLIDGHTHILWWYKLDEFLKYAMRGGTTTIITETLEVAFPFGYEGIIEFLEVARSQPIKLFTTVPPMVTISPVAEAHAMDAQTLAKLLEYEEVLGLGETYWSSVLNGEERILNLFAETLAAGKQIEGHSAGARGNRLAAYFAAGVSSCHESTTVEEALERMRLGIYTMIREGDIRMELPEISKIKNEAVDFRRLLLTTDGIGPKRLMGEGYMEVVVQKAIDYGFEPITAIQMATLNVAEHFAIDNSVGGIAPGKYADIVIIPNIRTIDAECVISNGKIIARDHTLLVHPREATFSRRTFSSVGIGRTIEPEDFAIHVGAGHDTAKVRVMDLVTGLIARETHLDMAVHDGEIVSDRERDILKMAIITTDDRKEKLFTGLVRGFGMKKGALASSAAWDACSIIVVGADDHDMATAVNRIIALNGGNVLCVDGRVEAELPMPLGGCLSDQPMENIVQMIDAIQEKMAALGCPLPDASLTLTIFSSPAIPFLRISEGGLMDLRKGEFVDLVVEEH